MGYQLRFGIFINISLVNVYYTRAIASTGIVRSSQLHWDATKILKSPLRSM